LYHIPTWNARAVAFPQKEQAPPSARTGPSEKTTDKLTKRMELFALQNV
jgi:hypothetical protein